MKLLPCPFCGTHRTKLVRWPTTTENFGAEIRCECGCHGPAGFGESCIPMAADLWNRREHSADRIKQLEDRIHRASMAFFRDGSDGHVASQMLQILEEERGKL